MTTVLDTLNTILDKRTPELTNRSIYLFVAEAKLNSDDQKRFHSFVFLLQRRLKEEAKKGMDRRSCTRSRQC
jgi:hypothetical protein